MTVGDVVFVLVVGAVGVWSFLGGFSAPDVLAKARAFTLGAGCALVIGFVIAFSVW
jgi:hypothetical protein